MDVTYTGIVIRTEPYREEDKLLHILTAEAGVITAVMRGVKKKTSKLRAAAQPFAFYEYELSETRGRYVVKTCAVSGSLFAIAEQPAAFAAGCLALEAAGAAAEAVSSADMFVWLLKSLHAMLLSPDGARLIAAKFLQKVLSAAGYYRHPQPPGENAADRIQTEYALSRVTVNEAAGIAADSKTADAVLAFFVSLFEQSFETRLKSKSILSVDLNFSI